MTKYSYEMLGHVSRPAYSTVEAAVDAAEQKALEECLPCEMPVAVDIYRHRDKHDEEGMYHCWEAVADDQDPCDDPDCPNRPHSWEEDE